jgi:hypothetical protein
MDLVAGRLRNASRMTITGDLMVNNEPMDFAAFKKVSAYVQQECHLPVTETVRECLMFNAQLRLPGSLTMAERKARVEAIINELVCPLRQFVIPSSIAPVGIQPPQLHFWVNKSINLLLAHPIILLSAHQRIPAIIQ